MSDKAKEEQSDLKVHFPETDRATQHSSSAPISPHSQPSEPKKISNENLVEKPTEPNQNVSNMEVSEEVPTQQHLRDPTPTTVEKPTEANQNVSNMHMSFQKDQQIHKTRSPQKGRSHSIISSDSDTFSEISVVSSSSTMSTATKARKRLEKKSEKLINLIRNDNVTALKRLYKKRKIENLDTKWKGLTLLHWAAMYGAIECIFWMLQISNVSPNSTAKNNWTPLHIAAMKGQDASATALLNCNRYTLVVDRLGKCALHMAAAHGHTHTLNALLQRGLLSEIEVQDSYGWTPIFHAVFHNRVGCIQSLIVHGAITDAVDHEGNSLVHIAAMEGHLEALRLLFYSGHPVCGVHFLVESNNEGYKPWQIAKRFYKHDISQALIAVEQGTFLRDNFENVAFPGHMAALRGRKEIVEKFIERDIIKINEPDTYGYTILQRAVIGGNLDLVRWLLYMKANRKIRNKAQETPLDIAMRINNQEMVDLLLMTDDSEEEDKDESKIGFEDAIGSRDCPGIPIDATKKQTMKRRCEKRVNALLQSLKTAVENFKQVGGTIDITDTHMKLVNTLKESERQIFELKDQLAYERLVRENIQAELDRKQRQINSLSAQCDKLTLKMTRHTNVKFIDKNDPSRFKTNPQKTAKRKQSPPKKQRLKQKSGVFIKVKKESLTTAVEDEETE